MNCKTHIIDAYPMPKIDKALYALHGAKHFCSLDLAHGYHQIPVAEEDIENTAFLLGTGGLYEFTRTPFGLCNAPATFMRLMDRHSVRCPNIPERIDLPRRHTGIWINDRRNYAASRYGVDSSCQAEYESQIREIPVFLRTATVSRTFGFRLWYLTRSGKDQRCARMENTND